MKPKLGASMLDLMAAVARQRRTLQRRKGKPLAVDCRMYETGSAGRSKR